MGSAAAPMMAHMYPYHDAVMLPRFAITREALENAIWVTAASGPITDVEGSVSPEDLQDRFSSTDTRLLAREVSLSGSRVISDFIVVESWVEIDDGVVLGTEMWQAMGATIQVDGGELLEHSVIYPQLLNTDFSPLLFSANRDGRMDAFMSQWSGLNIPYPLDPHPPSPECLNCPCCMEVCVGHGLIFSELDSFLHEYVKCPIELALTTQPVVNGSFESESMSDLMGPSYLLDLWQMPSSED